MSNVLAPMIDGIKVAVLYWSFGEKLGAILIRVSANWRFAESVLRVAHVFRTGQICVLFKIY